SRHIPAAPPTCSFPFGLRVATILLFFALARVGCAQRLAASMESSLDRATVHRPGGEVLNALRHQWNPHSRVSCFSRRSTTCSTPCGINGILPRDELVSLRPFLLCSTPCGINGILTIVEVWAPGQAYLCSTPCGINGILTG